RYVTYHSGADLGLFTQTIASAFGGFHNTVEGTSHFAYHFSPILYLCAPLLWLTHSALALVAIQAVATALVAPALYSIARKRTTDSNAAALACIALLYPPLQGVTFTDFHETAFLPATIAWLLWAIDARRFGAAFILVLAALSVKEDQALAMAFVGAVAAVYFLRRGDRAGVVFGCGVIGLSALTFWAYFAVVRPLAGATGRWVPSHFYAWSGNAPMRPLATEIGGRLTYLIEAFVPLALIPLRSPVVVLALPGLLEVLASREPLMYTMGQHYAAVWVPYVLVAFVLGGARLLSRENRASRRWVAASAALCALTLAFFSPLHLGHFLRWPNVADGSTDAMIARLPRTATIGTYDEIYAHLGFFPNAAIGVRYGPRYVVYDARYASTAWTGTIFPVVRRALASGTYGVVAVDNGVTLLERR
ncbi:MAG: DUF2079 domain-containing protein, partial [Candidatus Eremiobacteraeota bacterium]|nr:DUF2079 domain-containing protein [Candidatus Eremiobacteraeota bacterium]